MSSRAAALYSWSNTSTKKTSGKYSLFVITNQSGIGLGYFTEQEFLKFNAFFLAQLAQAQVQITDLYYCPHMAEDKCCCRKPSTYFIDLACAKYSLDLNNSYVIGDHPSDMDLAQAAGIKSIYVLSGHGQKHRPELTFRPTFVVQDITQILPLVL